MMPSQGRQWIPVPPTPKFEELPRSDKDSAALQGNIDDVTSHLNRHFKGRAIQLGDASLSPIPYDTSAERGIVQPSGVSQKGWSHIVDLSGRHTVMVKVAGRHIPFYRSTGMGGKFTQQGASSEGMWLPAMGIHHESGWINKRSSVTSFYGSPHLQQISEILSRHFAANPPDTDTIPKLAAGRETARGLGPGSGGPEPIHHRFINSAMKFKPIYGRTFRRLS